MYRNFIIVAVTVMSLFVCSLALASSFRTVPVRVYLDNKAKTASVRVINDDAEKLTVQLDVKSWRQDEAGNDIYEDTDDIIVFPRIAELEKGQERMVRVAYKGAQGQTEKTYKLVLQELPITKPGENALKFAVNMRLPIYVAPVKVKTDWLAGPSGLANEILRVKITNSGNEHITVIRVSATGTDEQGAKVFTHDSKGTNVHGGVSKIVELDVPAEACMKARTINVNVEAERGSDSERMSREFVMNADKGMCNKKPLVLKEKAEDKQKTESKQKVEDKATK
jgi:fimbrial chaperone protein